MYALSQWETALQYNAIFLWLGTYTEWSLHTHPWSYVKATSRLFGMMTSSNGSIFRVTGPLCGEFTGPGEFPTQRPVTWSFDVFFDLRLNKRLSKQPWGWWFETPSWSLWRQCNGRKLSRMISGICISMILLFREIFPVTSHGCHIISNHRQFDCLFNSFLKLTTKETLKICIIYWSFMSGWYDIVL